MTESVFKSNRDMRKTTIFGRYLPIVRYLYNICETRSIFYSEDSLYKLLCKSKDRVARSSHRTCSVRKAVLKTLAKFTEKHPCQSLVFNIHFQHILLLSFYFNLIYIYI